MDRRTGDGGLATALIPRGKPGSTRSKRVAPPTESGIGPDGVKSLAELPSLDTLRGRIVGLIAAPATRIAGVLQAPGGQLARVLGAYANKDGEQPDEAEAA